MQCELRVPPEVADMLRCPACRGGLACEGGALACGHCGLEFPIVAGAPVLIREETSVFTIEGCVASYKPFSSQPISTPRRIARRLMPVLSRNVLGKQNYAKLRDLLLSTAERPKVLVVGGGQLGQGMEAIADAPRIEIVSTDVYFGPLTQLICDAHDLPFVDGFFDAVIIQAVLEHVCDPYRCVEEVHRVLKPDGLVYAETPFMQQVHLGRYDFTRFTHLGHRRLFRRFEEIDSGAVCGPGMALAWSWRYFLLSFARSGLARKAAKLVSALTAWPLKYLDPLLIDTPGTLDAASGLYFLGRRSEETISDRELIKQYRGGG